MKNMDTNVIELSDSEDETKQSTSRSIAVDRLERKVIIQKTLSFEHISKDFTI